MVIVNGRFLPWHVGTIKQWMNQGAFLMRGLDKVHGEFSLTALAYNIKRAIAIVAVPGLIAAAKA